MNGTTTRRGRRSAASGGGAAATDSSADDSAAAVHRVQAAVTSTAAAVQAQSRDSAQRRVRQQDFAKATQNVVDMFHYVTLIALTVALVVLNNDPRAATLLLLFVAAAGLLSRLLDVRVDPYFWCAYQLWFLWLAQSLLYYLVDEVVLVRSTATQVEEDRDTFLWDDWRVHAVATLLQYLVSLLFTSRPDLLLRPTWSRVATAAVLVAALAPFRQANAFFSVWIALVRVVFYAFLFAFLYHQYHAFVESGMLHQLVQRRRQQQGKAPPEAGAPDATFVWENLTERTPRSFKMLRSFFVVHFLGYVLYGYFYLVVPLLIVHVALVLLSQLGPHGRFTLIKRPPGYLIERKRTLPVHQDDGAATLLR